MAYLFRLPGNTSSVLVQYSPYLMISILQEAGEMMVNVAGDMVMTKVPRLLVSQLFDNWNLKLYDSIDSAKLNCKFFINEVLPDDTRLMVRPYRLGNVAKDSKICWGNGNAIPYDLRQGMRLFWGAPFNTDLVEELVSVAKAGADVTAQISESVEKAFFPLKTPQLAKLKPIGLKVPPPSIDDINLLESFVRRLGKLSTKEALELENDLGRLAYGIAAYDYMIRAVGTTEIDGGLGKWHQLTNAYWSRVTGYNNDLASRFTNAKSEIDALAIDLVSMGTCECFDCTLGVALATERIKNQQAILDHPDINLSKEMFAAIATSRVQSNTVCSGLKNNFQTQLKAMKLRSHISNYTVDYDFVDQTAYYAGKAQIAVPTKADGVFYSLEPEEISKVPVEYHRKIGETSILLGFAKLMAGSSYLIDLGGHVFMYDTKNRKMSDVPKEILEPVAGA